MNAPAVGFCIDRTFPPSFTVEAARRLDVTGTDELWVIEDCFYTAGVTLAAAALTSSQRLTVGIGILPSVARNPAVTAMELATLAGLAPGRLIGGIGHGVQPWMGQMGARVASPLTALEEVLTVVRALLRGERVTVEGRYVRLDDVQLDQPPVPVPPVVAGVQGPKSLAVAGRSCDGIVLVELTGPTAAREALEATGRGGPSRQGFRVSLLSIFHLDEDRRRAREAVAAPVAQRVLERSQCIRAVPFSDELIALVERDGPAGLVTMPDAWWTELAPVGNRDDVEAFLAGVGEAGVDSVALFPIADLATAREQLGRVCELRPG